MREAKRKKEALLMTKRIDDTYMTKEAFNRLQTELKRLKTKDRLEFSKEVQRTAQMGDLSENAAYQMAKTQLRRALSRIITLEDRLSRAIIIQTTQSNTVQIGSTVQLESSGQEIKYRILGSLETNPKQGTISYLSPLGSALIGKAVGDIALVNTPTKEMRFLIKKID